MEIKGKNIDTLHQVLFGVLVLVVLLAAGIGFFGNSKYSKEDFQYLKAKSVADSLLIVGEFDEAESAYKELGKRFPNRGDFPRQLMMVDQNRERYNAFMELQEELETHIETIEGLEEYMLIIEERERNLRQTQTAQDMGSELQDVEEEVIGTDTDDDVNVRVKGLLDIINFDGADIKYVGDVENNEANGYGYAVFEKKGFYEGSWLNNRRNGKGVYYWQNGDTYEGLYVDGKREGFGIYTFASGEVYSGNWKNNLRHGEGTLINKKGKLVFEGLWQEDEPISKTKRKK